MKKSALALILAVLMAVGLLTIGAAAEGNYTVDLSVEPKVYDEGTAYGSDVCFFLNETVYCDGTKLNWYGADKYENGEWELSEVKYRENGIDDEYTSLTDSNYTFNNTGLLYVTVGNNSIFEAGKTYDIYIKATFSAEHKGTLFSCTKEVETTLSVIPEITSLTVSTDVNELTIDYTEIGLQFLRIPVSIVNQSGVNVAAVCDVACTASSGKTIIPQIVAYENGYAIQFSPSIVDLFEDDTLTFTVSYDNFKSNEITINVTVLNPQAGALAKIDDVYYSDIHEVIEAAINSAKTDVTVEFFRSFIFFDNEYNISGKNITFKGDVVLDAEVADGESTIAFNIKNGGSLTLDGITLSINGTDNDDPNKKNDGTAINIGTDSALKLVNGASLVLEDLERGITVGGGSSAVFSVDNSSVYVDGIDGNLTNGGTLSFVDSILSVENVGSYGLSASNLSISGGTASFNNVGYSALLNQGGNFEIIDGAQVNITECGGSLPLVSEYSNTTQVIDVSLKATGASFLVGEDSSVTLTNNKDKDGKDVNSINVGDGTLTVDGSYNGDVKYDATASCAVNVEGYPVQIVNKGDTINLPAAISKPGYIFLGWRNGNTTYGSGDPVVVTSNMIFYAVWANMPDVTPGTPDDGDDEPVVTFPFNDVSVLDWFYDSVYYVWENELMNGTDVNQFSPNSPLTRAMVWAVLARVDGETIFGDSWMTEAQAWAVESGVSDGTDPTGYITREQLVTMLYRFAGEPAGAADISGYPDAASISDWAADAMAWAVKVGLIEGDDVGALNPTANSTRAHAATFFMRFCER